ncbi:MAG: dienelactone hydrolase, partial [Paracoccaceae bacterium]
MHNRIDLTRPAAPELARRGPFAVGVRTLALVNRGQVDVFGAAGARADRELVVELWYPAVEGPGGAT